MVSVFLFAVALLGLIISKKFWGDYFSPPAIYNFFWATALGLLQLDWINYDPLRPAVWAVILLSYLSFMGGTLIVAIYAMHKRHWPTAPPAFEHLDRRRFERVLLVLFLLGIFGFAAQLIHLNSLMGIDTFLRDPRGAREAHTNIKYLGFFNILNVANFVLAVMYTLLYKKPRAWVVLIMFWALATTLVTTDRTRFFYMIIWSFYAGVYLFHRVNLTRRVLAAGLATIALLFCFFLLIAQLYSKQAFDDNMEYIKIPPRYAVLADPYIYITGSFPVLQAFLADKRELAYGKNTFEPVVKVIELLDPGFQREALTGKFYRVPIELNVCTYVEPYYRDLGILGIAIGTFLTGFACMWFYIAMRQRKTLFSIYFASILSFCITISIFVNHFTQTATWYFILVGYLVYRLCHSPEPQPTDQIKAGIYPASAAHSAAN